MLNNLLKMTGLLGIRARSQMLTLETAWSMMHQYPTCGLHSSDQNYHRAPQDSTTICENKLKREDVKWIIIDLAFNSWGTESHLPFQNVIYQFQQEKIKTENIFHLIEFALSFEGVFSQLKISAHREESIKSLTTSKFIHKLSNYKMQLCRQLWAI